MVSEAIELVQGGGGDLAFLVIAPVFEGFLVPATPAERQQALAGYTLDVIPRRTATHSDNASD